MPKFTVKSEKIAGFAAEMSGPGPDKAVRVLQKSPLLTSDAPEFHVYITQISNLFLSKIGFPIELIHRLLIVLHDDDNADIYINDFAEIAEVKVKRDIKKGDNIYVNDIEDIRVLKFPEVGIRNDDALFYFLRVNCKFGLYFDFTRALVPEQFEAELGGLKKELLFQGLLSSARSELNNAKLANSDALIFTEGKTDWKHLKKATERLGFQPKLGFQEFSDQRGGVELLAMCRHFASIHQTVRMVFLFDSDEEAVVKQLTDKLEGTKKFQSWGNNVYSFLLPTPAHRRGIAGISIELLYKDSELKRIDKNGRRLYFSNEFSRKIGRHIENNEVICLDRNKCGPDRICVIDQKVFNKDDENIALSKDDFAEYVYNNQENFNDFDFNGFREVFEISDQIIALPILDETVEKNVP